MPDVHGPLGVVVLVAALITSLIIIAGAIALVVGVFRNARSDVIRRDNEDLTKRVATLEHEAELARAREVTYQADTRAKTADIARLEGMVTQRANVEVALAKLDEHHQAATVWWEKMDIHNQAEEEIMLQLVQSVNVLAERLEAQKP